MAVIGTSPFQGSWGCCHGSSSGSRRGVKAFTHGTECRGLVTGQAYAFHHGAWCKLALPLHHQCQSVNQACLGGAVVDWAAMGGRRMLVCEGSVAALAATLRWLLIYCMHGG